MFYRMCLLALFSLCTAGGWGQTTVLKGRISGERGEGLPGANLYVSGPDLGAAADAEGNYRLEGLPAGRHLLRISYVGYQSRELELNVSGRLPEQIFDIRLKPEAQLVEELVITATRAGERTPMTYVDLGEEELSANNLGLDAPYLLRWTPSAVENSDAGAGIGYTGLRIRGSDATRINVTINGIPLNDAESQGVFWVNMPDFISSAESVQIQRGVGSSTNGAGAFGATINLSTLAASETPFAEVNASAGSFNTWRSNLRFGSGLLQNRFLLEGRLSRIYSDGYIDRARADLWSYFLSGTYRGKASSLTLNVFSGQEETYQAWYGVPPDRIDDRSRRTFNPAGSERPGEPYDDEVDRYGQTHFQALYAAQLGKDWRANVNLHYTIGGGYFEQYKAGQTLSDYGLQPVVIGGDSVLSTDLIRRLWLDNDFYGTTYSLSYGSDQSRFQATLGGGYNIYEGLHFGEVIWAQFFSNGEKDFRYYENDARKTDFNVYSKFNYTLSTGLNAYLDLQYRRVGYHFLGFNRQGQNVDQRVELSFFNPKAGLTYALGQRGQAYASFAVGGREPNRDDFVESSPDSRPRPERLYNTELGYRHSWSRATLGFNLYHMYYRDQLALNGRINDVGAYTRVNIDRSYRLGLEISGGGQLAPGLNLEANATLSRNRVEKFTEYLDVYDADFNWLEQRQVVHRNTDLSFSPAVMGMAQLSYRPWAGHKTRDAEIALMGKYVGRQYIDNTSDAANSIDPYAFADLRLRYLLRPSFAGELEFSLLVQNLFDALYEANAWSYRYVFAGETALDQGFFPQAGRNVLVGMRVRW